MQSSLTTGKELFMKRLILAAAVLAGTFGVANFTAPEANANIDCSLVRCMACPPGTVFAPTGNDCCRCKPV
jgi:hypothetical protein